MSDRFYCPAAPRDGRYHLSPEESRHLSRVCRLGIGDRVEIFDGRGFVTGAEVVAAAGDSVELVAVGEPLPTRQPPCSLTLATAVPKGDRLDWIVEKATELGVDRLIPIIAERSVVVPRGSKLERLRRSIVEASKQMPSGPTDAAGRAGGMARAGRFLPRRPEHSWPIPAGRLRPDGRRFPQVARWCWPSDRKAA